MTNPDVLQIPAILHALGVNDVVLSPGSRNAPLSLSFARLESINKYVNTDERSAAFMAVGMSISTKKPVALACTSGSAGLNYLPAISEAYFNQVPLVVLTADRPAELINKRDGQTIFQDGMYGKHVKQSFNLAPSTTYQEIKQTLQDAVKTSIKQPHGPVHINIPFSEPFYPPLDFEVRDEENISLATTDITSPPEIDLTKFSKVAVLIGQLDADSEFLKAIEELRCPIFADVTSSLSGVKNNINHHALIMGSDLPDELRPDLIISFGKSIVPRETKEFLRSCTGSKQIHINEDGLAIDTFGILNETYNCDGLDFLNNVDVPDCTDYLTQWKSRESNAIELLNTKLDESDFNEFSVMRTIVDNLPEKSVLHLGNSMPIRYANYLGTNKGIEVHCNRGTSGIDGCLSTAVGYALKSAQQNYLVLGDWSFLYDRNAFLISVLPKNLAVIILNNEGGGIFRLINGPNKFEEVDKYFVASHTLNLSKSTGRDDIEFHKTDSLQGLQDWLQNDKSGMSVLEVITNQEINTDVFRKIKALNF